VKPFAFLCLRIGWNYPRKPTPRLEKAARCLPMMKMRTVVASVVAIDLFHT